MKSVHICHLCRNSRKLPGCSGPCPCPEDGRDIVDHAREGKCPLGQFSHPPEPPPAKPTTGGCGSCGGKSRVNDLGSPKSITDMLIDEIGG